MGLIIIATTMCTSLKYKKKKKADVHTLPSLVVGIKSAITAVTDTAGLTEKRAREGNLV